MPNFYAHTVFGRLVLSELPADLAGKLQEGKCADAYLLGQYGPDPLFFYKIFRPSRTGTLAYTMHKHPVYEMLPRMKEAADCGDEIVWAYTAGFFCHYALDSRCHAYVLEQSSDGGQMHTAIEVEFDRFLAQKDGLPPGGDIPQLADTMPKSFYDALAKYYYPGIEEDGYSAGLSFFERFSRIYGQFARRQTIPLFLAAAAAVSPNAARVRDLALIRPQGGDFDIYNEDLYELLQMEVEPAAEHLTAFLRGEDEDLDWYCRSFHGVTFPPKEPEPPVSITRHGSEEAGAER